MRTNPGEARRPLTDAERAMLDELDSTVATSGIHTLTDAQFQLWLELTKRAIETNADA